MDINKKIELRKRSEEMIKYWNNAFLILILGLFGAYWIIPKKYQIYTWIGISLGIIAYFITLAWYNIYHANTTKKIKNA